MPHGGARTLEDSGSEEEPTVEADRQPEPSPLASPDAPSSTPTAPADSSPDGMHSEGEGEPFVVPLDVPGANPEPVPDPTDAAPPSLWRVPDGRMNGARPAEPALPTVAPPGSLTGSEAYALAVKRGEAEAWPLIGRGGAFEEVTRLADGSARYAERDRATVAAERREMERGATGSAGAAS